MPLKESIQKIRDSHKLPQLLILISFLVTFVIARDVTYMQKLEFLPNQAKDVLHIHHLVPGIFAMLISGYFGLSFWNNQTLRKYMAILFGVGAALTIDEFALWLYLEDVYWEKQGRTSIDAVIVVASLFTIAYVVSAIHDHYHIKKLLKQNRLLRKAMLDQKNANHIRELGGTEWED